jgi:hypothetical protein
MAMMLLVNNLLAQQTTATWNAAANPNSNGLWSNATNWSGHVVPVAAYKAVFNVNPVVPCVVNGTAGGGQVRIGDDGPRAMIVTNGGNLSAGDTTLGSPSIYLSVQLPANNLTFYWPTSSVYLALQASTNLASPVVWQFLTNTIATGNGSNLVVLPVTGTATYFRLIQGVDASTMNQKLLMGYQGWFACPGDGSAPNAWWHWFHSQSATATNLNIDFMPDTSELAANELFGTAMTYSNGSPVYLYSSAVQATVLRHFKWMQDYHLDGVFLQRFLSDLSSPEFYSFRNQVTTNVTKGAETYGRVFAIMYDVSGQNTNNLVSVITNDWAFMVNTMKVTSSPRYLHHKGKLVVALWGFGFNDGNHLSSPQQAQTVINWFKAQDVTVMGGVPSYWRSLTGDSYTDPAWTAVYLSFDVLSPWSVGRYVNHAGADNYASLVTLPDLAKCKANGIDYMPVAFPGFSAYNETGRAFNFIPRNDGSFYWEQIYNDVNAGCNMIYGAMFDEVNEGTAMYKQVTMSAQLPAQGAFVTLNSDGYNLPSDWYLQLADQAALMLRGQIPLQSTIPITPP